MKVQQIVIPALLAAAVLILTGCPPTPPCDEKINDKQSIEDAVLSNPAIQQVGQALAFQQIEISDCYVDDAVGVTIRYLLPVDYSEYAISYRDHLVLDYSQAGTISAPAGWVHPDTYDLDTILAYFRGRVRQLERHPRIRELLEKTGPDPNNPTIPLFMNAEVFRSGYSQADYSFVLDSVLSYTLPNDIGWQEYPEIGLAHQAMETNLLVGPLASCSIGRGEFHAYTTARGETEAGPWYVTVALQCEDGWKDAYVQINPDGSYEKLEIQTEY